MKARVSFVPRSETRILRTEILNVIPRVGEEVTFSTDGSRFFYQAKVVQVKYVIPAPTYLVDCQDVQVTLVLDLE